MNFKYLDKEKEEWKLSIWPWATTNSMNQGISSGQFKPERKIMTWADINLMRACIASMVTGRNIGRRSKYNVRASEAALANGTKGIKELFTAGCPTCGRRGDDIPREKEEFKKALPGLYCPDCNKTFITKSIYGGMPVFAVAAGPSLSKNGEQLKRVKGKYPIFAVDTAMPALQILGIKPDYMITVEVDPLINEMKIDSEGVTMIATMPTDPIFRRAWKGPVYLMDTPPGNKREIRMRRGLRTGIGWASPGGNVSSVMYSMLCGVLPSYIIMVGHDFSYSHLMNYYAHGGPMSMIPGKEVVATHDIYGNKVFTDNSLYSYKEWTNATVKAMSSNPWGKVVNATEGGILGATYYDPDKFIRTRRYWRELTYRLNILGKEKRWPSREEAQENGFKGKNLDCIEYMTLKDAIDKYCPLAEGG